MAFLGRHQGYLSLRVGSPVLKQIASGDQAIGICNTEIIPIGPQDTLRLRFSAPITFGQQEPCGSVHTWHREKNLVQLGHKICRPVYLWKSGHPLYLYHAPILYSLLQCIRTKFSLNNLSYFTNLTTDVLLILPKLEWISKYSSKTQF